MAGKAKAIVINPRDNVATALVPLEAEALVTLDIAGRKVKVKVRSAITMGHKFALQDIARGADVTKYGEPIGQTTAAIGKGEHVHVHNVISHRGRKEGA